MGIVSKIADKLHSDKHQDETPETTSSSTVGHNDAHDSSNYTGSKSDTAASTIGPNTTSTSHTPLSNTASSTHDGLNSDDKYNTTSSHSHDLGTNGGHEAASSSHHGLNSSNIGHSTTSDHHGPLSDATTSGQHVPGSSTYDSTPGAFPSSAAAPGHAAGSTSHNHTGRDAYTTSTSTDARHAPGPYGTREDYGSTGPATHTLGPHSSNAANIADPRVRPEPEKMKDHHTVGPHQSDMLNKMDPRVDSDPTYHGYPRDPTYNGHGHGNGSFDSADSGRQTGGFVGGHHARLENRGSIPTAGGLPVGAHGEGPYNNNPDVLDSRSQGVHGSSDRHHDAAAPTTGAGAGAGAAAAAVSSGYGHSHGHHEHGSSHHVGGLTGESTSVPTERKMGGAYEAGYRDAMEHAKAEQRY